MKAMENNRLDVVVSRLFSISRSQSSKAIKQGAVKCDGVIITSPSFKTKESLEIDYIPVAEEKPAVLKPEKSVELDYIYRDEDIAIINKPRGMVVHPAPGHSNDTLVNYLFDDDSAFDFDPDDKENIRPGIVHRIDKDTSGLLVVAQNPLAQQTLSQEVREGDFHRNYLAQVRSLPSGNGAAQPSGVQRPVAPQGSTRPDSRTGRPSSPASVLPP